MGCTATSNWDRCDETLCIDLSLSCRPALFLLLVKCICDCANSLNHNSIRTFATSCVYPRSRLCCPRYPNISCCNKNTAPVTPNLSPAVGRGGSYFWLIHNADEINQDDSRKILEQTHIFVHKNTDKSNHLWDYRDRICCWFPRRCNENEIITHLLLISMI